MKVEETKVFGSSLIFFQRGGRRLKELTTDRADADETVKRARLKEKEHYTKLQAEVAQKLGLLRKTLEGEVLRQYVYACEGC